VKHILTKAQAERIGAVWLAGIEVDAVLFTEDELAPDCKGKRIAKRFILMGS